MTSQPEPPPRDVAPPDVPPPGAALPTVASRDTPPQDTGSRSATEPTPGATRATRAPADAASMPRVEPGIVGPRTPAWVLERALSRQQRRAERVAAAVQRNRLGDHAVPTWLLATVLCLIVGAWIALLVTT